MKRRGRRSVPFSLFAFQDIMASVIGIVFLIVLIMALSITDQAAGGQDVPGNIPSPAEMRLLREKMAQQEQEVAQLEQEMRRLEEEIDSISPSEDAKRIRKIRRLSAKLEILHEAIERGSQSHANLIARRNKKRLEARQKGREVTSLKRRLAALQKELSSKRHAPNVVYIVARRGDALEPWLLEVSDKLLRVASKDTSSVLEFAARSFETRKREFLEWAARQSSRTHYFVALIKPSGVRQAYEELLPELKKKGFDLGRDLLPEQWRPF